MLPEFLQEFIQAVIGNPWLLGGALALATLLSEDAALLTGTVLVSQEAAGPVLVIASLVLGILGGDIGLYGLGFWARTNRWLRRRIPLKAARSFKRWLEGREAAVLFLSRFMPGTRLPTYVSFGFLRLSLLRFTLVMTIAGLVWVGGAVLLVSEIQDLLMKVDKTVGILLGIAVGVLFIFVLPGRLRKSQKLAQFASDTVPLRTPGEMMPDSADSCATGDKNEDTPQ